MSELSLFVVSSDPARTARYEHEASQRDDVRYGAYPSVKVVRKHVDPERRSAVLVDRVESEELTEEERGELAELGAEAEGSDNLVVAIVRAGEPVRTVSAEAHEPDLPPGIHALPDGDAARALALLIWSCTTRFVGAEDLRDEQRAALETPWRRKARRIYRQLDAALHGLPRKDDATLARGAIREALRSPVLSRDEAVVLSNLRSALDKYEQEEGPFYRSDACKAFLLGGSTLLRDLDRLDVPSLRAWLVADVDRLGLDSWADEHRPPRRTGS